METKSTFSKSSDKKYSKRGTVTASNFSEISLVASMPQDRYSWFKAKFYTAVLHPSIRYVVRISIQLYIGLSCLSIPPPYLSLIHI